MMTFDPQESAAKFALDNAELIERVPALQRDAVPATHNDSGGLILVLPSHPLVTAFIQELDKMQYETVDLKTARRRLRVAGDAYQLRVAYRVSQNLTGERFNRFVSLSSILIARAAGEHWHREVQKLEHAERIKKHNERAAELVPRHVIIDGHPVRVRRERERPSP